MKIPGEHIDALLAFGYTEIEARFLYIVATYSGYFLPRQFVAFAGIKWGKRSTHFAEKIESHGHAAWREYQSTGGVYHLFAKKLYGEIGKENIRNRRKHSLEFIRTRIVLLDFVLAHQQFDYFETEQQKVHYFCEQLQIPKNSLPAKVYAGSSKAEPTLRYFVDKYPLFLDSSVSSSSPVVTFSYVDPGQASIAGLAHHLRNYDGLLQRLGDFCFVYIANSPAQFVAAERCFSSLVNTGLQGAVFSEVQRYFRLRNAWEIQKYGTLTNDDIEWLHNAMRRFEGEPYASLYRKWTAGSVTDQTLRTQVEQISPHRRVAFRTCLVDRSQRNSRSSEENERSALHRTTSPGTSLPASPPK
jgi:hypothetical protein